MSKIEESELRRAFGQYDTDKSGFLERPEVVVALQTLGIAESDTDRVFSRLDANNDGKISFEEFSNGAHAIRGELLALFAEFDKDKNGEISLEGL
jgi:Ca2+-binding EF-hand superfamily protein